MCADRDEVDESLLDFSVILKQVKLNQFQTHLPSSFSAIEPDSKKRKLDPDGEEDPPKRRGNGKDKDKNSEGNLVKNVDQNEKFKMLTSETWEKHWTGPKTGNRPKWGKKFMCPRWHTKGHCFNTCKNRASHVKKDEVPKEKQDEYVAWMEKVRASN